MPHDLNLAQQEAVETLSGPLLVLAGAGTGKTRVVTYRIAELIQHGTKPQRILAVTFTNRAAAEMQERIGDMLGKRLKQQPEVSTFHSLCVRILRRHIRLLGYPQQFAIYDRGDQESLARNVLREIRVPSESLRPGELLSIISGWKSSSIRPGGATNIAQTDKEHLAAIAYRRYQQALKTAGAVDFDDLLLCTEDLFAKFPEARMAEADRFDHLLVDEYQDTNGSQYRIVRALAKMHRNLCVVGDDDQSIYGWRGAEVQHILRFANDWPGAKVVRLEENYRSTAEILGLANELIVFNKTRHDKVLRPARPGGEKPRIEQYKDEATEAKSIVEQIRRRLSETGVEPKDFAILFRTNEQPRPFETELRQAKLPYVLIGGMSFFDRKEVRDILSYLKLLVNTSDEVALLRIINTPARGISKSTVEKLMDRAVSQGKTVWDLISNPATANSLPKNAAAGANRLVSFVADFRNRLKMQSITDVAKSLIHTIDYEGELRRVYPDENDRESRWAAVQEVVNAIAEYERKKKKRATMLGFLDEVCVSGNDFDNEKDNQLRRNAIVLMTLHSAKGLEFPFVHMVGMEEGILPHRRSVEVDGTAIEEERRLCYVGITRAQERLTLSMSLSRMKWGKPRETIPSRFLYEMTGMAERAQPPRKEAKKKVAAGKANKRRTRKGTRRS